MRQRPQYLVQAFAKAGHDTYFVDGSEPKPRFVDGVHIVPSLRHVPSAGVILYVHFAPVRSLFDSFDDPVIVYDILDDLSIYDADEAGLPEERRVRAHHPLVMDRADVVTASAPLLVERHLGERSDILFVENGVDVAAFTISAAAPEVFTDIPRPVAGYHGMMSRWFDFDLVAETARLLPEVSFVLVGPVDPGSRAAMDRLVSLGNVFETGPMPSDTMPGVVQGFDVGLVPFVVDDMTRAVSPLKMFEYLAAGIGVVASPLPVCVDHPLVTVAPDAASFASAVVEGLESRNDPAASAERRSAAEAADWSARIAPVRARLADLDRLRVP